SYKSLNPSFNFLPTTFLIATEKPFIETLKQKIEMACFIPDIPNEKSKQAFRQYLERSGVVDRITSTLVMLFSLEERPEDPLDFIRRNLGDPRPEVAEYEAALKSLEDARLEGEQLQIHVDQLRRRLAKYEGEEEEGDGSDEEKCGV
ncbi:hypothetical protein WDU94_008462, partial [Cyamophila willieti]